MKIVLLSDVEKVGEQWDILDVSDGFARNVLIPQGLAVIATSHAMEQAKDKKEKRASREELALKHAQELASALDEYELVVSAKANEEEELYAAVSPKKISDALAAQGHDVSPKMIEVAEPIKQLGEHKVTLSLDHGLEATLTVIVEEEM